MTSNARRQAEYRARRREALLKAGGEAALEGDRLARNAAARERRQKATLRKKEILRKEGGEEAVRQYQKTRVDRARELRHRRKAAMSEGELRDFHRRKRVLEYEAGLRHGKILAEREGKITWFDHDTDGNLVLMTDFEPIGGPLRLNLVPVRKEKLPEEETPAGGTSSTYRPDHVVTSGGLHVVRWEGAERVFLKEKCIICRDNLRQMTQK